MEAEQAERESWRLPRAILAANAKRLMLLGTALACNMKWLQKVMENCQLTSTARTHYHGTFD